MAGRLQLFCGNSHPQLAEKIAYHLNVRLGEAVVGFWRNGETRVRIEENVRGNDVFLLQALSGPANHHIMEMLLMIDALKRASAGRITAVIPYYAYARQEKKMTGREPIAAKLLADLITKAGADRILTVDLHAPAIEGFFDIPVDHLRATQIVADYFRNLHPENFVIVAPDAGRVGRALELRDRIGAEGSLAFISKMHPSPDVSVAMDMVGEVAGKVAIIADDMILTGGTLIAACEMLLKRGALEVYACATHAALVEGAAAALQAAPFKQILVSDSVPFDIDSAGKFHQLTIAPLLAEAIIHIHKDLSVSTLFR